MSKKLKPSSEVVKAQTVVELINTPTHLKTIKGFNFWIKFFAVIEYLHACTLAIVTLVLGIVSLFTLVNDTISGLLILLVALICGGITIFFYFAGKHLYRASSFINKLQKIETQNEYNELTMNGITNIKKFAKMYGIYLITYICLYIGFLLFYIIAFFAIISMIAGSGPEIFNDLQSTSI
jgi:hypothetical protein